MKHVLTVVLAISASVAAASAQIGTFPNTEPPPSAFGPDPILQITTIFQARIEGLADARDVPTTAAQEMALLASGKSREEVLEGRLPTRLILRLRTCCRYRRA